jgi:preprotein translocase subunit SecG
MNRNISTPVAVAIIVVVLLVVGVLLYRGLTGGVQGDGREGEIQAAPPVPTQGAPPDTR